MTTQQSKQDEPQNGLTENQEELLDAYLQKLDHVYEQLKENERLQVEIETEHLKKILSK